jgi:hypothetical protein
LLEVKIMVCPGFQNDSWPITLPSVTNDDSRILSSIDTGKSTWEIPESVAHKVNRRKMTFLDIGVDFIGSKKG